MPCYNSCRTSFLSFSLRYYSCLQILFFKSGFGFRCSEEAGNGGGRSGGQRGEKNYFLSKLLGNLQKCLWPVPHLLTGDRTIWFLCVACVGGLQVVSCRCRCCPCRVFVWEQRCCEMFYIIPRRRKLVNCNHPFTRLRLYNSEGNENE